MSLKQNCQSHSLSQRYRGYLTVVSEEGSEKATVTVFDVQNKFIAFSAPIKPVMGVVAEWGTILMITQVNCPFHTQFGCKSQSCRMAGSTNYRKKTPK